MELAFRVLIVGLAAWRLSALLAYERGPWAMFERLRQVVRVQEGPDGEIPSDPWSRFRLEVEEALSCVWCLSVWVAALLWGVWALDPGIVGVVAAAAIVVTVERWNHRGDPEPPT